ncbi:hypothetical protein CRV08_14530 [Halarcobacter ebronensis]|uniref:Uncharacterized protein n=1 Tax=Halarcobacter ebronensis TaxID=1462615 RepID=A0A4Q0Y6J7_9BACT|nr:hypothetical protein [Halarcobacter ebronensis]RXJ65807.1 hypothetical protein CRV08_14530 [Halarcobacter ebronensis]
MNKKEIIENDFNEILNLKNSNTTEKNIFLSNIQYIKKLLNEGISFAKQVKKYNEDCGSKISESTYKNYCKEYLFEDFNVSIYKTTFNRNIKHIKAYFLLNETKIKCSELYFHLKNQGYLMTIKKNKNSFLPYLVFVKYLKEILDNKKSINLIEFDKTTIKESFSTPNPSTLTKSNYVDKKQKIDIELLDGNIDNCPLVYLKNEIIMRNNSNNAYDFNEKNYIVIPSVYKNNLIDFEFIKKSILQKEDVKNYSLIFHDNGKKDGNIYIYRLIDKELHVLKKFSSGHCMDFEIYYNNGIKKFLSIFEKKLF